MTQSHSVPKVLGTRTVSLCLDCLQNFQKAGRVLKVSGRAGGRCEVCGAPALFKAAILQETRKVPRKKRQWLPRDRLTRDQFEAFVREFSREPDLYWRSLLLTLAYTGMRVGEVCSLRWEDVNFENETIRVRKAKWGSDRFIPMRQELRQVLEEWRSCSSSAGYVWPSRKPSARGHVAKSSVHRRIKAIAERLGMSWVHAHTFRHTFVSLLLDQGVPLHVVADLAGHRKFDTTRAYAKGTTEEYRRAIQALA